MDIKEVQLWEKYCKEIDEYNKPFIKAHQEFSKKSFARFDKDMAKYELKLKKYHQIQNKWDKEERDYEKLSWYKKIFTKQPFHWYWENTYPSLPYFPLLLPVHTKEPTREDFMNWLVENKKLLK